MDGRIARLIKGTSKVGKELVNAGIMAVIFSLLGILLYIWLRFQWNFAFGAVIALIHDVILTLGFFSVFQFEFNLATVAAVLTIVGYSLNDTVVIFDRIRENLKKYSKMQHQITRELKILTNAVEARLNILFRISQSLLTRSRRRLPLRFIHPKTRPLLKGFFQIYVGF